MRRPTRWRRASAERILRIIPRLPLGVRRLLERIRLRYAMLPPFSPKELFPPRLKTQPLMKA